MYNELLYITLQLTNNDLLLQVYCSPSLKEHLHNPVMTVLACDIERKESILHAHSVVCACVCGVVCINHICVLHVHGVWLCVHVH